MSAWTCMFRLTSTHIREPLDDSFMLSLRGRLKHNFHIHCSPIIKWRMVRCSPASKLQWCMYLSESGIYAISERGHQKSIYNNNVNSGLPNSWANESLPLDQFEYAYTIIVLPNSRFSQGQLINILAVLDGKE
ncbi:unnamed protein product [Dicrocoelium dendriticum]|nr:unnamed protein product [Dicrocoelium dendriticum]